MRRPIIERRAIPIAMAAALLLGAACADDGGAEPAAGGSATDEATATGPTTTETGPMGGGDASDSGGGRYDYGPGGADAGDEGSGVDADVTAENYAFTPFEIEAGAGSELSVGNASPDTPHTFTIDGTDVDVELEPMVVETITLDLQPGTYDFRCRFHESMTGTITIA